MHSTYVLTLAQEITCNMVHRQNVEVTNAESPNLEWDKMPNDKISNGTKCRKDKMSNGTKRRMDIMSKVRKAE
jgi:hypothetical protein